MFKILFYRDKNGYSELEEFLIGLRDKSETNKDCRIQLRQITLYITLLKERGFNLTDNVIKHLKNEIWELRPGNNRVLYFLFTKDSFVLLHHFRKKTNKTPRLEIERAVKEANDYRARNGGN